MTFYFTQEKQTKESEMKEKIVGIHVQTWTWQAKADVAIAEPEECAAEKVPEGVGVTVLLGEMVTMHAFHLQEKVISLSLFMYWPIYVYYSLYFIYIWV